MQPTVGRIVHFIPKSSCVGAGPTGIERYAAIVTQVNEDGTLELATFGPNSVYFQHGVPMYGRKFQGTADYPEGAWAWGWAWPQKEPPVAEGGELRA